MYKSLLDSPEKRQIGADGSNGFLYQVMEEIKKEKNNGHLLASVVECFTNT